jgi:hypothetical protein
MRNGFLFPYVLCQTFSQSHSYARGHKKGFGACRLLLSSERIARHTQRASTSVEPEIAQKQQSLMKN